MARFGSRSGDSKSARCCCKGRAVAASCKDPVPRFDGREYVHRTSKSVQFWHRLGSNGLSSHLMRRLWQKSPGMSAN